MDGVDDIAVAAGAAQQPVSGAADRADGLWVERLSVTNFRNYHSAVLTADRRPVVLLGANGAGKTNILEAVSMLAPGQGLRRAAYPDLARQSGQGDWAVAATVHSGAAAVMIGTGRQPATAPARSGRLVRINGAPQSGSGALAEHIEMVWLTPTSDGLFTGPAADRRRFLDRLVLCFDPTYRNRISRFDRAMRQRNRLLDDGQRGERQFEGLEIVMAETGVAIAAARVEAVAALKGEMTARRERQPASLFPWADLALAGTLEEAIAACPAVDVEDGYRQQLAHMRERDRAAGRTLLGPHRSDLEVAHGAKAIPARICSTGEQKSLLISLVLAHAEISAARRDGITPILLLDEIAAHLDGERRDALFRDLLRIGTQAWMTGTDRSLFSGLAQNAKFFAVANGDVTET